MTQAEELRQLHQPGKPLVLPNAWDVASARLVEAAGFPAIATSSGAVAAAIGYDDNDTMPPEEAFGAVGRIARNVAVPVTADIERGYQLSPAELVKRLSGAGAVGCNVEDTDHHGEAELVDVDTQSAYLAAIKEAARASGTDIVLNARIDVFRTQAAVSDEILEEAVRRARSYLDAGADCVYPIRLSDDQPIAEFVQRVAAPVNIMLTPRSPSIERLAQLGVARVSLAGGLMRTAYSAAQQQLEALAQEVAGLQ